MITADVFGRSISDRLVVLFSLMFLVVANIPGTIALRYTLQALCLILVLVQHPVLKEVWQEQRWPVLFLTSFIVYAGVHCLFFAQWPEYARGEYRSQLLVGGGWFVIGLVLFRRRCGASILDLTIVAGGLLAFAEFCLEALQWHATGQWPYMQTFITATHLELSFTLNLILAFVLVSLCFGYRQAKPVTCLPRWCLLMIMALIVFVSLRAGARNGMIGLLYLSFSILVVYLLFACKHWSVKQRIALALLVVCVLSSLGGYAFQKDARNQVLIGSAEAGWHYDQSTAWFKPSDLPVLSSGLAADDSAYKRVAWIHKGLTMIYEQPMGFGYGRGAFGMALVKLGYHDATVAQSHSGFIDLGVGLGLAGLIVWFAYCGALVVIGYREFVARDEILGLVLALVSGGFVGRMLMESIQRDHLLYLFLFITAALLAEIQARKVGESPTTDLSGNSSQL